MPVYFRKAKPFPRTGDGDCGKGKRPRRKEMMGDETDAATSMDVIHSTPQKERKPFFSKMYSVFIKH